MNMVLAGYTLEYATDYINPQAVKPYFILMQISSCPFRFTFYTYAITTPDKHIVSSSRKRLPSRRF
ncbi:hypothetical protein [Neobacillus vireti]|uniref:hypothetical protein n=1 Tax=Neobacillus vireti TaxID=220686 RepID=UPI002FFF9437